VVIPQVFEELEQERVHLTGLFLLASYLTPKNARGLLTAARGKSRKEIKLLIAARFPKPDVPERIREIGDPAPPLPLTPAPREPSTAAPSGPAAAGENDDDNPSTILPFPAIVCPKPDQHDRIEPLSGKSYAILFTASAELVHDIERARELLSHTIPSGKLSAIFGRALRCLVQHETKRLIGSDKPRRQRALKPGSRHIPVAVQRAVRERDGNQCAFVDAQGRRCEERRFLTVEHREPFARGGETSVDNCCLHCAAHNLLRARQFFGDEYISKKIARQAGELSATHQKIQVALIKMGFKPREAKTAVGALIQYASRDADLPTLLRAALQFLSP
jgi:hypothetical protein